MTLSFSEKFKGGTLTCFLDKIWDSLTTYEIFDDLKHELWADKYLKKFNTDWAYNTDGQLKLHTIRKGNRWKAGNKIHFVINNRTKNRFQFAPVVICTGVQRFKLEYYDEGQFFQLKIDDRIVFNNGKTKNTWHIDDVKTLAINDGFPSLEAFLKYFHQDFEEQIIHWTNLKY